MDKIIFKIKNDGPISFHDFMEMCLYYPALGYYTSGVERIGSKGDYFTSPTLTPLFGEMIALQIIEMMDLLQASTFTIVEYGGGDGTLCKQILKKINDLNLRCGKVKYFILEKNQSGNRKHFHVQNQNVCYINDLSEVENFTGVVISNELLDNFPFHRFIQQSTLNEIFVGYNNGNFIEYLIPASAEICKEIELSGLDIPENATIEWRSDIKKWLQNISTQMTKGFIITVDYGHVHHHLLGEYLSGGTLSCYSQHQRHRNPYIHIGGQDITADVNFSQLRFFAECMGFHVTGFTSQARFLLAMGMCTKIDNCEFNRFVNGRLDVLKTFVMDMGKRFKVMIHHKGASKPLLSGMQFAEPSLA